MRALTAGDMPLPSRRRRKMSPGNRAFDIVKILIIFSFILFTLFPIFSIIITSISPGGENAAFFPSHIDWFAIKHVLADKEFYTSFGVTLLVVAAGTFLSVLCMSMLGYALSKKNLPFRRTIFVFFLIAMLFSGGMVPNYILMNSLHLTDTVFALIFPNVVNVMHMILIKNYFEGLPESLEESAKVDGAGNFTVFFKIILPMSLPMIVTISLFTAVVYWNNYSNALLYISSQASELYPLPYYIVQLNAKFADPQASVVMGEAFHYMEEIRAATILLSMLPITIAYPFFLKYFTKGVTVGSDK